MKCCGKEMIGVEYSYTSPNHYDGVSEWYCPECKSRIGRWSGKELKKAEAEGRFGAEPIHEPCPKCLEETSLSL